MGVPALFRWLSQKYPKIISPVIEDKPRELHGEVFPVDTTQPNPNGEEFDNLYLDMNGIVHPCSHPEDKPPPANEAEMMLEVFKYTDRVVNMTRPRKLLMIAVDGCAPRAKMNQQRSRRFRSAQDAKAKDKDNEDFMKMLKAQNNGVLPQEVLERLTKKTWDSNSITPGTPFMDILAESLRYWCRYKLNTDPLWAKMEVIISDATVPGEGEHKIMQFVRSQRSSPEHNVNTSHVMYGLDADLIMLGLATHEPHFRILREDVFAQDSKPRGCKICGQTGHRAEECRGEAKQKSGEFDEKAVIPDQKPFIWLHVAVLREYLAEEMKVPGVEFDLERAIDDWVFMCFFVGNDFLPHLPSLDIREEGIDTLIGIWREQMPLMGGWVTQDGRVNMKRAEIILEGLAKQEANIFKKRRAIEEKREQKEKRRNQQEEQRFGNKRRKSGKFNQDAAAPDMADLDLVDINSMARKKHNLPGQNGDGSDLTYDKIVNRSNVETANNANKSAAAVLRERLKNGQGSASTPSDSQTPASNGADGTGLTDDEPASKKRKAGDMDANDNGDEGTPGRDSPVPPAATQQDPETQEDTVKLWEEGYEGRYYEQKFHVAPDDIEFRHQVARDYVAGLQWVLLYYFQGCPSWTWFYPHHYAPFAQDFVGIGDLKLEYDLGKPFRPYEQLMGVMPAASKHTLPEAFHSLMTDEDSEIKDFYPEDFHVDLNGKKFAWQGVAILPFIDEKRLMDAMATRYPLLSEDEKRRNEPGRDALIFREGHPLHEIVMANFYSKKQGAPKFKLDPRTSRELAGKIEKIDDFMPFDEVKFPGDDGAMPNLDEDHSMTVYYDYPTGGTHKSMLLRGVKLAPSALTDEDRAATRRAASTTSRSFGNTPLRDSFRGGRGGRGGFRGGHHGSGHHGQNNFDNPFASHLQNGPNPPFPVPGMNGQVPFPPPFPPPPHMFQQGGMPFPPPPPGMMAPNGQFPPNMPQFPYPPPPTGYNQHGNNPRGGYHGHRGRR